jgi:tetratricopeptide (TPR) repeat protein
MDKPTEVRSSGPVEPTTVATQPAITPPMPSGMNETAPSPVIITLTADGPLPVAPPGYEILGVLGRGGMGVVYKARQVSLNRVVALKMILAGGYASSDELIRFVAESEAVARMDHPNVVRVFHAGQHDGLPFFAMEYVAAGTLSDRLRDGPLVPQVAAKLVEQTARGIAACHAAGLLHRDLKPQNVLLAADGTPKVTDFGLVKLLDGQEGPTTTGAVMGTPSYMAPEQARGDTAAVGRATDVYGLGAVLYALLTGRPPFQAPTPMETLRQVEYDDPVTVRELQPGVPRDLETICLKCLEKDPVRRYPTADTLADDLRRFLTGEPILARPAGVIEKGWKWVRRNSLPAAAASMIFTALTLGAGLAVWQARRADHARRVAESAAAVALDREARERTARQTAETVAAFMQEVFAQGNAEGQAAPDRLAKKDLTVKEAMDFAAQRIGDRFAAYPDIEAAVRTTLGQTYIGQGAYAEGRDQLTRALVLLRQTVGDNQDDTIRVRVNLATASMMLGDFPTAERLIDEAAAACRPETSAAVVDKVLSNQVSLLLRLGRLKEAEPLLIDLVARTRSTRGDRDLTTLMTLSQLAVLYSMTGHYDRAEPLAAEAHAGHREMLGDDHPHTQMSGGNLANIYFHLGRLDQAETLYRHNLSVRRRTAGDTHPDTLIALTQLAHACRASGRHEEAITLCREAVSGFRQELGPLHPDTLYAIADLAVMLAVADRAAEAEPLFREALAGRRKALGDTHPDTLVNLCDLAQCVTQLGRPAEAVTYLNEAVAGMQAAPTRHALLPAVRADLGLALIATDRLRDALPHLQFAWEEWIPQEDLLTPENRAHLRQVAQALMALHTALGQPTEAAAIRQRMGSRSRETLPPPRPAKD